MIDPPSPPASGGVSTRDRLLDAASRLFYEQGIHVGVEAVCRAAGVSKKSLYQLFGTKDELVAATLERVGPAFAQVLLPPADDGRPPRARILHVFERLEALEPEYEFRGCPFVAAAVQVKSSEHPASAVARRQKDALTAFFEDEASRAGVRDPVLLARQLTVVFDGASARSVVQARNLDGLAVATASAVLDAAGVPTSAPYRRRPRPSARRRAG
jgi:AcrR family transcriptional regulator